MMAWQSTVLPGGRQRRPGRGLRVRRVDHAGEERLKMTPSGVDQYRNGVRAGPVKWVGSVGFG
jgi:hypothetical protein